MPYVASPMYRGTLGSSNATLYTVPSGKVAVVTSIVLCNKTSTDRTANVALDGVSILASIPVEANSTVSFDLKQALNAASTVTGYASVGSAIDLHVSGVVIS